MCLKSVSQDAGGSLLLLLRLRLLILLLWKSCLHKHGSEARSTHFRCAMDLSASAPLLADDRCLYCGCHTLVTLLDAMVHMDEQTLRDTPMCDCSAADFVSRDVSISALSRHPLPQPLLASVLVPGVVHPGGIAGRDRRVFLSPDADGNKRRRVPCTPLPLDSDDCDRPRIFQAHWCFASRVLVPSLCDACDGTLVNEVLKYLRCPDRSHVHSTCMAAKGAQSAKAIRGVYFGRCWNDQMMNTSISQFLTFGEIKRVTMTGRLQRFYQERYGHDKVCACEECFAESGLPSFLRTTHWGIHPFKVLNNVENMLRQLQTIEAQEWTEDLLTSTDCRRMMVSFLKKALANKAKERVRQRYRKLSGFPGLTVHCSTQNRLAIAMMDCAFAESSRLGSKVQSYW